MSSRKVRRRAAERKRLGLECLDPRLLLAGDLLIAEFMAVNGSTLADSDGEFSDWFEIHNTSGSAVNLDGYYATDDEDDLTKWRFPSVVLAAGQRRVVFASGKDRINPAAELHTNFSLSADGEFFALVRPDGATLEHAYAPAYPPQLSDISYGPSDFAVITDTLIDEGAPLAALVPSSNGLGSSWTQLPFDDAAWTAGDSGVGYDTQIGAPVFALIDIGGSSGRNVAGGVPQGQIGRATDSAQNLPATMVTSTAATGSQPFTIAIDTGGRGGTIDWRDRGNSNSPDPMALLAEDHVKNNAGFLNVTLDGLPEGIYNITSYHADVDFTQCEAIKVFVNGVEQQGVLGHANFDLDINSVTEADLEATAATFTVISNGVDPIAILFDGSAAFDKEVPLSGLKLIANGPLYEGHIATYLEAEMLHQQTSAYVRVPFVVNDAEAVSGLRLYMHYDDGFVAYLNGTEVARRNAPASLAYDSAATIDRNDNLALSPETIDLSAHVNLLVDGENVLAIHGLNDSAASSRFLLAPLLEADVVFESDHQYFTTPTPGAANISGVLGLVGDTSFSVDRGFYDAPIHVAITTATPGAEIRYTVDGSSPTATTGQVYSGPVLIDTTTTLRAAAYRPGYLPSNVDTHTYIFLEDVIRQDGAGLPTNWGHAGPDYDMDQEIVNDPRYSGTIVDDMQWIPTLSLVMDQGDWFGAGGQGIYIQGTGSPRAVSMELIHPDGTEGFQIDASVQIQGGSSTGRWKTDKLSMRVKFKAPYGPTKLEYPLFGDDAVDSFDTIILDAVLNYSWLHNFDANQRGNAKYVQDQIVADLQNAVGGYGPHGTYSHLYLNGVYWGMYYVHERPDESFAASYLGGNKEDYDVLKHNSGTVVNGTNANYAALLNAANQDLSITANYEAVEALLDVEDFIDYMIVNFYLGNSDWAHHNWYASYNRVDPEGRWRYHSWDAEHVLTDVNIDVTGRNDANGPTRIHQQLRANPEYRLKFADHVQRHFFGEGILTPDSIAEVYQRRIDEVDRAIVGESARWGDNRATVPYTHDDWQATQQGLFANYFPNRTSVVLAQFQGQGLYPQVAAPQLSHYGGIVAPGFELNMTAADNIYYTLDGSDPRLPGGGLNPAAIPFQSGVSTSSLIAPGAVWKYLDNGSNQGTAWRGSSFNDSAWQAGNGQFGFGDGDETTLVDFGGDPQNRHITTYFRHTFTVADPTEFDFLTLRLLRDDGAVVYLNNNEVARSNMPAVSNYQTLALGAVGGAEESAWFQFQLNPLDLVAGTNVIAVEIHQNSPSSSDLSFDLELVGATATPATPAIIDQRSSLRARAFNGNSWSALSAADFYLNIQAAAGNLVISEINYNPFPAMTHEPGVTDNNDFEFLELKNVSDDVIDLEGVHFTTGLGFDFSNGSVASLAPGEFVVIVKNLAAFEARYGTGINVAGVFSSGSLSNSGESLTLVDRFGSVIQQFSFDDSGDWPGRADGSGSSLEAIDPSGDPNDPLNWRSSTEFGGSPGVEGLGPFADVVVNEVLTHTDPPQSDSIELHNTTASPIHVGNWWLSDAEGEYFKYRIPAGTVIPAGGYVVYNASHFSSGIGGSQIPFALDAAHGDEVWLVEADASGRPTRFADHVEFVAAPNGEAFGRWPNAVGELFPMTEVTLGGANSGPRFGPLLISELMYHANDPDGAGPLLEEDVEFVEIYNSTASSVNLTEWQITGGVTYAFAAGSSLAAGSALVIVSFDPAAPINANRLATFRATYGIDASVTLVGPYSGNLSNAGERIRLRRPDEPPAEEPGFFPLLLEDEANYTDDAPWPTSPDGDGDSLTRLAITAWGNDPASWSGSNPSPGTAFATHVAGRHLFYNGSAFDAGPGASPADDMAVIPGKSALLPNSGQATAANFSNFADGITGIMIDVSQLPPAAILTAADFQFRVGRSNTPASWDLAINPASITIRRGAGAGQSDRVTLIWPAGSIMNTWLEVRMRANANTGLAADDVFYFGNAAGDATGDGNVNASDFAGVRSNPHSFLNPAAINDLFDLNRDRRVDAADMLIVRDNATALGQGLPLITPTGGGQFAKSTSTSTETQPGQALAQAPVARKIVPRAATRLEPLETLARAAVDYRAAILAELAAAVRDDDLPAITGSSVIAYEALLDELVLPSWLAEK